MAISDIPEYAHLTESDVAALGAELDAIRADIEADRGERDARYLRNTIRFQRGLLWRQSSRWRPSFARGKEAVHKGFERVSHC